MGIFCPYGTMQVDLQIVISLCESFLRYKMTINHQSPHPPHPAEKEHIPVEKEDTFVDRFLIRIGDIVIQNFAFLVFITVVWGLFIMLIFGGAVLIYTVSQRFVELAAHEQQRQIIQEQHLEQMQLPSHESNSETIGKPDESEWFLVLTDTAEQTSSLYPEESVDRVLRENPLATLAEEVLKSTSFRKQELITASNIWQVSCGEAGLTLDTSYPCLITQIELIPPDTIVEDVAASN